MGPKSRPYLFMHIGRLGLVESTQAVYRIQTEDPKLGLLMPRGSAGESLLSLFIFQSSLKADDKINLKPYSSI